jgi:hypothetical protein
MQGFAPGGCRKSGQKRANQVAVENGFLVAQAGTRSRDPQCDSAAVAWIRRAFHVASARQAIDREAHGRRGHTHVPRQIVQAGGLDFVEMIENARLMGAKYASGSRIADMARMAGKEDPGIEGHELRHGVHEFECS